MSYFLSQLPDFTFFFFYFNPFLPYPFPSNTSIAAHKIRAISHFKKKKLFPLCGDSDLDLDASLDVDDDLLDDLGGGVQVDEALVDAHLEGVPGLGTLTVGGLAGGDLELLGGKADGALDAEVLGLGAVDELLADLLEGGDLLGGEGDADLVDLL